MKGITIKDIRPNLNQVSIGELSVEQVFQFKEGDFGMVLEQDCARGITNYYSFGAHRMDWLIGSEKVIPVTATLVIETGGVKQ